MENELNFVPELSLCEIALGRVVINLWYESGFSSLRDEGPDYNQAHIGEVKEKVLKLALPEPLKKRMLDLVVPIQSEIRKAISRFQCILNDISEEKFDMRNLKQLRWTCTSAIDYRNTAVELVRQKRVGIEKRFRLASSYCLEDYIPVLWAKLPKKYKSRFHDEVHPLPQKVAYLEYYWASVVKGEEFKLKRVLPREYVNGSSLHRSFFKYSACKGSKAATEYFFLKLTDQERDESLLKTSRSALRRDMGWEKSEKPRSDVLCFLLSLMPHEERMQIFSEHPASCLICFLDWHWRHLFLDVADLIWNFLPEYQYGFVVGRLACNGNITASNGYHFPDLFQKLFLRCPNSFRKRFVEFECRCSMFMEDFIICKDTETIKVVLRNMDAGDRLRLFCSSSFLLNFSFLMITDWHLAKFLVLEGMRSKEDRETLKTFYLEHTRGTNWKRFFEWFDGVDGGVPSSKRLGDEPFTKSKRLCLQEKTCLEKHKGLDG